MASLLPQPLTRCLYEILGVARDVDFSDLRKAYKQLALKWHPDKNLGREKEAAERFNEICNAYRVLSNARERAWYDEHSVDILNSCDRYMAGSAGGECYYYDGSKRLEDEIDLWAFFMPWRCATYTATPQGFYVLYGQLFSRLEKEERRAFSDRRATREATHLGPGPRPTFPAFGGPDSSRAEVEAFYSQWAAFETVKSFDQFDVFSPASPAHRAAEWATEGANRSARQDARRLYNGIVRELVAFVKRRDRRLCHTQATGWDDELSACMDDTRGGDAQVDVSVTFPAASSNEHGNHTGVDVAGSPESMVKRDARPTPCCAGSDEQC